MSSLGGVLIRAPEGWATAYRYYSDKYITQEKTAQTSGKGIWAGAFEEPYQWRKKNY